MTVHLFDRGYSYISVPKCGSTSLKWAFFRVENGVEFQPFRANGVERHIHNAVYPFVPFGRLPRRRMAAHARVCLVRDPVTRLASCYADRVIRRGDLDRLDISPEDSARGVTERPEFDRFVTFLDSYRRLSPVLAHHCEPLPHFLGPDPAWYQAIFAVSEMAAFVAWSEAQLGISLPLGHRMKSPDHARPPQPSRATRAQIEAQFAEDIALYGPWFA